MKTEFILMILEFFSILMALGGISLVAVGVAGLYKQRLKELKMEDVKDKIPEEVDDLEIAEHVKKVFLKKFRHMVWSLCNTWNVITPTYSIVNGDPYKLKLHFGKKYALVIKMDPGTGQFMFLEEVFTEVRV